MADIRIHRAETAADIASVEALFREYLHSLGTEFSNELGCSTGLEDMRDFPASYRALFLGELDGEPIAACGLRRVNSEDCELKRLYCRPEGRGYGFGRKLTEAVLVEARGLNCARLVLDTEPAMVHAGRLYEAMGFTDIPKYYHGDEGCSRFMGRAL